MYENGVAAIDSVLKLCKVKHENILVKVFFFSVAFGFLFLYSMASNTCTSTPATYLMEKLKKTK